MLRLLAHGASIDDVVVPHEALEFLRGNVRRGIPLPALLRSYRLGHAWLWDRWSQALQERVEDSGELAAGQDQSSAFMFAYVDRVSDALVEEFGTERERMMRGAAQLRAETVRAILAGEPLDEEVRPRRLGYDAPAPPRRDAVASGGQRGARASSAPVGEAAAALGPGEPLVVPSGAARFDVWCGLVRRSGDAMRSSATSRPRGCSSRSAGRGGDRRVPQLARRGAPGGAHRVARRQRRGR